MRMLKLMDRVVAAGSPAAALKRALQLEEAGEQKRAFSLFSKAAAGGIPEAQFWVGRAYLRGSGVPISRKDGAAWLERAAQAGWTEAQTLLATLFLYGLAGKADKAAQTSGLFNRGAAAPNDEPDYVEALKWARLAADSGSPEAQALLGYILTSGPDGIRDLAEAEAWYKKSADADCAQGYLGIGLSRLRSAHDYQTHADAAEFLMKAAGAGLPTALYLLGVMYERGAGMPQNLDEAASYYKQAAEKNPDSLMAVVNKATAEKIRRYFAEEGSGETESPLPILQ